MNWLFLDESCQFPAWTPCTEASGSKVIGGNICLLSKELCEAEERAIDTVATKTTLANWNGQEMLLSEVKVSVLDRAFLFGEAIYEVIRIYQGRLWRCDDHLNRLATGIQALKIKGVDVASISARVLETSKNSQVKEGLAYIQVTRGVASRCHRYPEQATPNVLVYVEEYLDPCAELRQTGAKAITHSDIRWARNDIKATSLVANCMAAQAAAEAGCLESILIDSSGLVTEGSHTSIFGARDGCLLVSPSAANVLPGITKQQVLELAADSGICVVENRLKKSELFELDELFLTGTPEEIVGIVQVDDCYIGNGLPGMLTKKLQQAFRARLASWLLSSS